VFHNKHSDPFLPLCLLTSNTANLFVPFQVFSIHPCKIYLELRQLLTNHSLIPMLSLQTSISIHIPSNIHFQRSFSTFISNKCTKGIPLKAVKGFGERGSTAPTHSFLISALDIDEWSASLPGLALSLWRRTIRYPFCRRLGGPQSRCGHRSWRRDPFVLLVDWLLVNNLGDSVCSQTLH
jgi:hypothetical protein